MKKFRKTGLRLGSVLLAFAIFISLMPAASFALDPQDCTHDWSEWSITREATPDQNGEKTRTCSLCGATETEEIEYTEPFDPGPQSGEFTLNGVKVKFKKDVVEKPDPSLENSVPGRVWIKGNKSSMSVNWVNPGKVKAADGVIILRATGDSDIFAEVAKVKFRTVEDEEEIFEAKTSYTDKTAKRKNTKYTYRVITYFERDDITYISKISKKDWAAGQTSASKLQNAYTGKVNKKAVTLQSKETTALRVSVSNAKSTFMPKSRRWSSSNESVATVSKGKVTAKKPGKATIRCRLASGHVVKAKITVVGAYKPGTTKLKVDYATTSSITLIWDKVKYATSYDVYKSDDGLHWDKPKNTSKTTYTFKDLTKSHRYTFYVVARNDHEGLNGKGKARTYTSLGDNSNVINQKAVVKRRLMTLSGWPSDKSLESGDTFSVTLKIEPPLGRKAELQMRSGKKWVTKRTISLPKGSKMESVLVIFPKDWWGRTTEWRFRISATTTTAGYTTDTLKITSKRRYQNPPEFVQIKNSISRHGYNYYISEVLVDSTSTREDHVEALIKTAGKYKGDPYKGSSSGAPGYGVDASGLIIQSCYGAGVDLWPIGPATRPYNCVPAIYDSKLGKVKYTADRKYMVRGDLVFFRAKDEDEMTHAGIYLGNGSILHASPIAGKVKVDAIQTVLDAKYTVAGVRRIFN